MIFFGAFCCAFIHSSISQIQSNPINNASDSISFTQARIFFMKIFSPAWHSLSSSQPVSSHRPTGNLKLLLTGVEAQKDDMVLSPVRPSSPEAPPSECRAPRQNSRLPHLSICLPACLPNSFHFLFPAGICDFVAWRAALSLTLTSTYLSTPLPAPRRTPQSPSPSTLNAVSHPFHAKHPPPNPSTCFKLPRRTCFLV
ncbi:hypothetical protein GALMADRAFT_385631 [Galerina marginata CBS 339.88]|uniref:Uncharacterized protein n=1 Tax=Galerina marginata (strain CBS 339.88) TaxID=685588 RepID=A0A067U2Y1_GALM3|nr:hypothetical protein GALMADRAFT_385631 [Galerina marginata CBS 339.88]